MSIPMSITSFATNNPTLFQLLKIDKFLTLHLFNFQWFSYLLLCLLIYCTGGSVDQLISDFGPFDEAVIIKYLKQILLGVGYLHEYRAIHRDIKGE